MARDGVSYDMTGLPELLGKLDGLSYDMKYRGGRFALLRAAKIIQAQAKANAEKVDDPSTPESIAANIGRHWGSKMFRKRGDMMWRIGVMGGAGGNKKSSELSHLPGGDTRYWRLLETGTEHMRAQPIFRQIPDQVGQEVVDTFVLQYGRKLDRALKQAAKAKSR